MPKSPPPPTVHITDEDSGEYGSTTPFHETGPGTLLMDADAWLISAASTIVLDGQWTATINGTVVSSNFSGGGDAAIELESAVTSFHSSLTFGAGADIDGFSSGVFAAHPTDIINKGHIGSESSSGIGISEILNGSYTINNSGSITSGGTAIEMGDEGPGGVFTRTIINSGTITASVAIEVSGTLKLTNSGHINGNVDAIDTTVTNSGSINGDVSADHATITNSGVIDGDVDLGGGGTTNNVFTDFGKITVGGKTVTHQGTVTGTIDFGGFGNDHFTGGNNAETVTDGNGSDVYKLGGGNDIFIATGATGSDGADTVDGGTGVDLYDASAATGAITVNLDTKVHGAIAASSASVNGATDKVTNFEDVNAGSGDDTIYGNASANHINGGDGEDTIFGLAGNDVLNGGFDDDNLYGGAGRDIMTGGDGGSGPSGGGAGSAASDTFHYLALSDSGVTAATRDEITDFDAGGSTGDIIDLSAIDAIPKTSAHDEFHFIGESKWDGVAGELRYVYTATQTIIEADVNGDKKMDFSIALDGHHTLTADDFLGVI